MRRIDYVLNPREIFFYAIRSQGAGGQNINKVATAIQVVFPISESSLPEIVKSRLFLLYRKRINADGELILKAQEHRTQERNRSAALKRLQALIDAAASVPERRIPTKPTRASVHRRLEDKHRQAERKRLRDNRYDW